MTRPRRPSTAPVVLAAVIAVFVIAGTLVLRSTIKEISVAAARGNAEFLSRGARLFWGETAGPPSLQMMQDYLQSQSDNGLRYIAIARNGRVEVEAGEAIGAGLTPSLQKRFGSITRFVSPEHRPPPRKGAFKAHPPSKRPPREGRFGGADGLGGGPLIVLEFEPTVAIRLGHLANVALAVAVLMGMLAVLMAIAFTRSLAARDALGASLEQGRKLATLGEMSAMLAHEIRNPLASLKGHAQLLVEQLEAGSKQRDKAQLVVRESLRLEALTNDLLEFVRTGELRLMSHDPFAALKDAAAGVGSSNVETVDQRAPEAWVFDRSKIIQVLQNLVRNAVEASGDSPVIATVGLQDDALCFTVRDNGPGLGDEDPESLFEPFVTGSTRGIGLGLAIARRIVERHGGHITGSNHPEGGAVFVMKLPPHEAT